MRRRSQHGTVPGEQNRETVGSFPTSNKLGKDFVGSIFWSDTPSCFEETVAWTYGVNQCKYHVLFNDQTPHYLYLFDHVCFFLQNGQVNDWNL